MNDWTAAWQRASALALSARTRRPLLRDPAAARLLAECLHDVVDRDDLPLLGWLILPDGLHVIGLHASPVPWTTAIGRVKQAFSRRVRRLALAPPGPAWRLDVRVRPLAESDVPRALAALHEMPVREALCPGPEDWPWSSARQARATPVARSVG